ncbi:transglutaminase-like domain-containing protein [Methylobacterium sp. SyP6R]|uniref:transglutaminase-like domain-containing protein n=1 Tax=Methylobacterium sp. SyP6R TaxID=2718876 RepID=UPI001F299F93|nr:transglutaminase family protein [Methylobacterium sp. SyP6R]MCF4128526.1 transglutaminase family protein [Methylobacterium sp. SyP6R]
MIGSRYSPLASHAFPVPSIEPFAPCAVLDCDDEAVQAFVDRALRGVRLDDRSIAVALYYAVRDEIFYEIFGTYLGSRISASLAIAAGRGFCLHKALIYAAACRTAGIPCRVLAATVRNHVTSSAIEALVGGDVFLHWYNEVNVGGEWLKAAPVFNKLTCKMYGIQPLEFDGRRAAIAQPYHEGGTMRFLSDPIRFDNPTADAILRLVAQHHPKMISPDGYIPRERSARGRPARHTAGEVAAACASTRRVDA